MQNPPHIFLHKTVSRFLLGLLQFRRLPCTTFYDFGVYPITDNFPFFSSVVRGNLENCSETRRKSCAEIYEVVLHLTAWNLTQYNESYDRFSLPVMSDYWFVQSKNPIRQTT